MVFGGQVPKQFICECGKSYKYKTGLNTHKRLECGKEPNFHCPRCQYKTKHKGSLKRHIVFRHVPNSDADVIK